ncbi:AAA family ATPase [Sphingomonas sp.]|uniref:AAA family ATPase n=1 Tax=Sphingomonas sp. TaxID=28214 RepID=UPI00185EEBB1|nr:AAA family ATPase [Sphingomonas sp.]MBA3511842.1 AAA family ATPase [Sphingomonas sp.]
MTEPRYSLAALAEAYPPLDATADRPEVEIGDYTLLTADDLGLGPHDPIRVMIDRPQGDDRSKDAYWCALDMLRAGYSEEQIVGVLMNPDNAVSGHVLDNERPLRAATRSLEAAKRTLARNGQGEPEGRGAGSNAGEASGTAQRPALPLLDPAEWAGKDVPPREWSINGLFLANSLAALTGPGAAGKSLLMQQAATAVAAGARFLGMNTVQGNAAYITAEDDTRELHERQVSICTTLGIDLTNLSGRLHLASLIELADKALVRAGRNDRLLASELFAALRQVIEDHGLKFLALDNAGHFYGADENVRSHVVAFLGLLSKLALETGCSIVLISHPNKSGSTYSGVTAWQNQVRVQAHLQKPENEQDSNVRELRLEKANYAPPGEPIRMLWHHGAFTLEDEVPADDASRTSALRLRQNEIFYACLAAVTARQQSASAGNSSPYYAPRLFAPMTEALGMTVEDFERTMHRLLSAGAIETGPLPFNRPSSRNKAEGLRRTGRRQEDDNEPPM